jgi:hypothetical protein
MLTTRITLTIIGAVLLGLGIVGCSTAQCPEAETVGTFVSTTGAVYTQPAHATTDLSTPALVTPATSNADDNGFTVTPGEELPEVAPKGGLTMGQVRQ